MANPVNVFVRRDESCRILPVHQIWHCVYRVGLFFESVVPLSGFSRMCYQTVICYLEAIYTSTVSSFGSIVRYGLGYYWLRLAITERATSYSAVVAGNSRRCDLCLLCISAVAPPLQKQGVEFNQCQSSKAAISRVV